MVGEVFDSVNVKRITRMVEQTVNSVLGEIDLFEPSSANTIATSAGAFLASIKERGAITDYTVSEPREETWEELYPLMPLRLLAIESYEKHGYAHHSSSVDIVPTHFLEFPYEKIFWRVTEDGEVEHLFMESSKDLVSLEEKGIFVSYEMRIPREVVCISFTPIKPVTRIVLSAVLTNNGEFSSVVEE
jgi:hypothetical protein